MPKYGDQLGLPVSFSTLGVATSYANAAAFTGAGGTITWLDMADGVISPQPTWTLTPSSPTGRHLLAFTVPSQKHTIRIVCPANVRTPMSDIVVLATGADEDTIIGALMSQVGTPTAVDRITTYALTTTDGDGFASGDLVFPLAALQAWGYTDFSAAGWTFSAAARLLGDVTTGAPLFTFATRCTDTANRKIEISYGVRPTAFILDATAMAAGNLQVKYDIEAKRTESFPITAAVAGANGTLTVAGDKRKYFTLNVGSTFVVDTGPNAGTYTPTAVVFSGGNTVITVATLPSSTVSGNVTVPLVITGISGTLTSLYQVDRT